MSKNRSITSIWTSTPTLEGAGVHLRRAFGFNEVPDFDPFLLLDDFRSRNPDHYLKGFPWHPHRGIETITYILDGEVEHGDSLGNNDTIGPGDVQWMTAGSGIIHQEMPKSGPDGIMGGFQLWANLPASHKMMRPRYRDVKSGQIPSVITAQGATVRIVCGEVEGTRGPVQDVMIEPEYLDVTVPSSAKFLRLTRQGHTVFAYVIEGGARFSEQRDQEENGMAEDRSLVLFGDGDGISVTTEERPVRFLLISGKPLREPVAWQGPIVMNTREELRTAFEEYSRGTFIKA